MACECFILETADGEVNVPKTDLLSLDVELDADLASMFRLRLAIRQRRTGGWTYLDDEQFRPWKPMTISGGFAGRVKELMSGYITHVKPDLPANAAQCSVEVWGLDGSVLLDREERSFAWPNETDSAIATTIFRRYGLTPVVTQTRGAPRRQDLHHHSARNRHAVSQTARPAQRIRVLCRGADWFLSPAPACRRSPTSACRALRQRDERQSLQSRTECARADRRQRVSGWTNHQGNSGRDGDRRPAKAPGCRQRRPPPGLLASSRGGRT